jgi:hypothetical protein
VEVFPVTLPDQFPFLLILGLAAGTLSGLLGIGAGVLVIPALVYVSFAQKDAQGIALAVMVPMALVGALRYKLHPEIQVPLNIVAVLAATAVVGAVLGSSLAAYLPTPILRRVFAVFVIMVGVRMLLTR